MPEGDTIHKIANYLAPKLASQLLVNVRMADPLAAEKCRRQRIDSVYARGKHLFVSLHNGTVLRSHLGMYGSWHRYAKGEPWRKPRSQASLVLETETDDYVCFNAKEVELVSEQSVRERIVHTRLGPDLIADAVDIASIVKRARDILEPDALLADALLDQRIAAGIGNVYKSEVMFMERLSPSLTLADISDESLARCFETAATLLRNNLGGGKRVTRDEGDGAGRLWVYGRTGLPCHECAEPIVSRRFGRHHRGTFWCPRCQEQAG